MPDRGPVAALVQLSGTTRYNYLLAGAQLGRYLGAAALWTAI